MKDQASVYAQVARELPGRVRHVSGGLPDVRGVSDVDIALLCSGHARLIDRMPEGTEITSADADHTVYSVPGYDRPVNVYATNDASRVARSLAHRRVELELAKRYPALADLAAFTKEMGHSTEAAWAMVLDLDVDVDVDVYTIMAEYHTVLKRAATVNQREFVDGVFSVA